MRQLFWRGSNAGSEAGPDLNWLNWLRTRLISTLNRPVAWSHSTLLLLSTPTNRIFTLKVPSAIVNHALTSVAISDYEGSVDDARQADSNPLFSEPSLRFEASPVISPAAFYANQLILHFASPSPPTSTGPSFLAQMESTSIVLLTGLHLSFHSSTLIPYYHYLPLSLRLHDIYPILGYYFSARSCFEGLIKLGTASGSKSAHRDVFESVGHQRGLQRIGERGRTWVNSCAGKAERKKYLWLLILEWKRICTD